jgi:hypothetical protein
MKNFSLMGKPMKDAWVRWSRVVGEAFLDWLAVPKGLRWLDVPYGSAFVSTSDAATVWIDQMHAAASGACHSFIPVTGHWSTLCAR